MGNDSGTESTRPCGAESGGDATAVSGAAAPSAFSGEPVRITGSHDSNGGPPWCSDSDLMRVVSARQCRNLRLPEHCDATSPPLLRHFSASSRMAHSSHTGRTPGDESRLSIARPQSWVVAAAFSWSSPTIELSASVVVSPMLRPSATSRSSRRMILPERVFGRSGVM
jgi:hypothetical protein